MVAKGPGASSQVCCHGSLPRISGNKWIDGWMDHYICFLSLSSEHYFHWKHLCVKKGKDPGKPGVGLNSLYHRPYWSADSVSNGESQYSESFQLASHILWSSLILSTVSSRRRMVHFVSGFRVAAWKQINTQTNKNSCRHIFRKTLSISSAYIIQSFILHRCSAPQSPPPYIPLSSLCLLPLLPNLLLLLACKYMCIRYSFFSQASMCVHGYICAHTRTQSCVSPPIFSNQILATFYVVSHKAALHACACSSSQI